jgi:hypothetical protein
VPFVLRYKRSASKLGQEIENVPANLAEAVDIHCQLVARRNIFRVFLVPGKHWTVKEVILRLVCVEHGEIAISERLLRGRDGRVVENETQKVDR